MAPTASSRPVRSMTVAPSVRARPIRTARSSSLAVAPAQHVQQLSARRRIARRAGGASSWSAGATSVRQRGCRIAQHDEQRALPRVGEIDRRLEQPLGQRPMADRRLPHLVLRLQVEQVPARVAEAEDLHALGEHLDLVRRAEHDADVLVADGRERVRAVARRARHLERARRARIGRRRRCRARRRCG